MSVMNDGVNESVNQCLDIRTPDTRAEKEHNLSPSDFPNLLSHSLPASPRKKVKTFQSYL